MFLFSRPGFILEQMCPNAQPVPGHGSSLVRLDEAMKTKAVRETTAALQPSP
jgi:hypothetical protein